VIWGVRFGWWMAHLEEVVADALGGGEVCRLRAEGERREVGAVLRVEGDVAGDGGGVLRRGAGRRLDLVRRAHGGVVGNSLGESVWGRW
jgi:hypothetical protein